MITPQTPADKLAKSIGLTSGLYLKREDLHPYGSHKGRSIPLMIKEYAKKGAKDFVISSSGNAALAAIQFVKEYNSKNPESPLNLSVYVGKSIAENKLGRINELANEVKGVTVKKVINPKQTAFLAEKSGGVKNLRQSTDDTALTGYEELAEELAKINRLSAVFIPTSSGTTAAGLFLAFQKLGINPAIHIIQTTSCHPFVKERKTSSDEISLASAISDRVGHRAGDIARVINESNGAGWIATNNEILDAMKLAGQTERTDISPNSALSVAGLKKAVSSGYTFEGPVVCLITGE